MAPQLHLELTYAGTGHSDCALDHMHFVLSAELVKHKLSVADSLLVKIEVFTSVYCGSV